MSKTKNVLFLLLHDNIYCTTLITTRVFYFLHKRAFLYNLNFASQHLYK